MHVVNRLYPEFNGGTEIHTYELCQELARAGERTVILTQVADQKNEMINTKVGQDGKMKVYSLCLPTLTTKIRLLRSLITKEYRLIKFFVEIIKKEKPGLVHFHHLVDLSPLLLIICRLKKIPHLLDLNDYWFICPGTYLLCRGEINKCANACVFEKTRSMKQALLTKINQKDLKKYYGYLKVIAHRLFWNILLNHTDTTLVAVSKRVKEIHEQYQIHGNQITVKYNGIRVEEPKIRKVDQKHLRVGFLGALIEAKGVRVLIRAFNKLKQKNVSLTLYGQDGFGGSKLTEMIGDNPRIKLAPTFDHRQLPKVLASLDLLVVPSTYEEAFCLVVSEGLAAHLPMIVSNIGGMPERVIDKVNGFLVRPGSATALTEKLNYVLTHYPAVTAKLDFSRGQFTLAQELKQLRGIYNGLAVN